MELSNISWWGKVTPKTNLVEDCELKCPTCKNWTSHKDWGITTTPCDNCDNHTAIQCPTCKSTVDYISQTPILCRKAPIYIGSDTY